MKNILAFLLITFSFIGVAIAEDYHVRAVSKNGRNATVIFHIPIPLENNAASISLPTALSEYIKPRNDDGTFGTFISNLQGIAAEELTTLQAGSLYEHIETVSFLAADTEGQKQTKIDNRFTALSINVLNNVRAILKFWGKARDVP